MKLIIRNLSRNTTEPEVKDLFTPFGQVDACDLVLDQATGGSKGFGFVEMPDESQAQAAIKTLNGQTIANSRIRVKEVEERK